MWLSSPHRQPSHLNTRAAHWGEGPALFYSASGACAVAPDRLPSRRFRGIGSAPSLPGHGRVQIPRGVGGGRSGGILLLNCSGRRLRGSLMRDWGVYVFRFGKAVCGLVLVVVGLGWPAAGGVLPLCGERCLLVKARAAASVFLVLSLCYVPVRLFSSLSWLF